MEYRKIKDQEKDDNTNDVEDPHPNPGPGASARIVDKAKIGMQEGLEWKRKSLVTVALTVLTSSQAILIAWSKRAGKYDYSVTSANFLVETLKCALSLVALIRIWENEGITEDNKLSTTWDEVKVYPIPAALYLIKNLLQYYIFIYVDAPSYQILKNLNIISTGVLYRIILNKKLTEIQWSAYILLCLGCTTAQLNSSSDHVLQTPIQGWIMAIVMALLSGFAGVYTEAVLALYAAQHTSGIVVNIGFQVTSVVPILCSKVMRNVGVEIVGQGALRLTGYLSELMHQKGINFASMYTVRTLKENLCYVAEDYSAELTKNTEASFPIGNEGVFTLSHERFQTGEIIFQPHLGGLRAMGLHQAVALCIEHCNNSEVGKAADEGWFKTVVLAGGSACLPGLAGRLEKELHKVLPSSLSKGIKVLSPSHGAESAWYGAKIISNLSTFPQFWCITRKDFKRSSGNVVHTMALDE